MSDIRDDRINNLKITGTISGGGIQSLSQAISVQMTASTTVGGIQQLDNVNNNFVTGHFTLHWEGALPDYTPAANYSLIAKTESSSNLVNVTIRTTGEVRLTVAVGGVTFIGASQQSSVATGLTGGQSAKITISVIRETATSDGSVAYYVNGVLLGSVQTIPAATPPSIVNSAAFITNGTATTRTQASSLQASRLFNRALTAAEVLELSINGPALADRGASQTPVYESDFSAGVDGHIDPANVNHVGDIDGIDGQDNWLRLTKLTNNGAMWTKRPSTLLQGSRYNYSLKVNNGTGDTRYYGLFNRLAAPVSFDTQSNVFVEVAAGATALLALNNFVAAGDDLYIMQTNSSGEATNTTNGDIYYVREKTATQIGLTSELLASNAQSDTGQIFDTSGNKNHALLPASGATVVGRPVSQTREVRWTNTWAGTNELQYIGGVNQAILPANAYIESIIGTVSGATPHDIIIGDGSDTDRYVTITTGLAAGTTSFTLANQTTDGTNLKLTVDPDTDATMSIAWVISYKTLES
jgi:hypothetical protein